ncbi:MAG: hypothetical protein KJ957_03845 [Candidatus Omnitrophica bacterium]|nr:hypothetical protein [Candidatus Omnitrophota bacterium]
MNKINKLLMLLLFFVLFLAAPLFAEELAEEAVTSAEDVMQQEELDEGVITGKVTSLDPESAIISVRTSDGLEKTFIVLEGETILWKGVEDVELTDIDKGVQAEVGYYSDEDGKLVASWVDILVEEDDMPLGAAKEPAMTGTAGE